MKTFSQFRLSYFREKIFSYPSCLPLTPEYQIKSLSRCHPSVVAPEEETQSSTAYYPAHALHTELSKGTYQVYTH